ncbi:DUF975 family protein [Solibaculum mannosilyticum]|uniref:DUF975 family protein n=1 Tax=Solibaculum mannosilyticum TaxID=2780922 RepID=UPI0034AECF09
MDPKTLKKTSKQVMHGHWIKGILACVMAGSMYLMLLGCEVIVRLALDQPAANLDQGMEGIQALLTPGILSVAVTGGAALLRFFLLTPLKYEKKACFWQTQLCETAHPQSKVRLFQLSYGRIIRTHWGITIRVVGWAGLLLLPGLGTMTAAMWATSYGGMSGMVRGALWGGSIALLLIGGLGLFLLSLRYWMTPYLLASCPKLYPSGAIRLSIQLMKGRKLQVIRLYLSLIGWEILKLLVVPGLYTGPRVEMTCARWAVLVRQPADAKHPVPLSATQEFVLQEKNA